MGFSKPRSEAAIKKHNSVQAALDSLLTGCGECNKYYRNMIWITKEFVNIKGLYLFVAIYYLLLIY